MITPEIERRNIRNHYLDMLWMGPAIVIEWYFLNIFAVRFGATASQLSALLTFRALFLAIGAGLCAGWSRRFKNLVPALSAPVIVYRFLLYLVIGFIPFLPAGTPDYRIDLVVGLAALAALPHGLAAGLWLGMLRSSVSEARLSGFLSRRLMLINLWVLIWVMVSGPLLDSAPFPLGYQLYFIVAFVGSIVAWNRLMQVRVPDIPERLPTAEQPIIKPVNIWKNGKFLRFAALVFFTHISVFMAAPIVPLYLVRTLNASDTWISLFSAVEVGAGALIMIYSDRLIVRIGANRLIVVAGLATALQTLILGFSTTLPPHLIGQAAFGIGWFWLSVLLYYRLSELIGSEEFPPYAAGFQMLISIALLFGPPLGTFLIENVMSLSAALILTGALRVGSAVFVYLIDVRGQPVPSKTREAIETRKLAEPV